MSAEFLPDCRTCGNLDQLEGGFVHGRLELLVAIPVAIGLLDDDAALQQQVLEHQPHVEFRNLGIANTKCDILEVAEQCQVVIQARGRHCDPCASGAARRPRGGRAGIVRHFMVEHKAWPAHPNRTVHAERQHPSRANRCPTRSSRVRGRLWPVSPLPPFRRCPNPAGRGPRGSRRRPIDGPARTGWSCSRGRIPAPVPGRIPAGWMPGRSRSRRAGR